MAFPITLVVVVEETDTRKTEPEGEEVELATY